MRTQSRSRERDEAVQDPLDATVEALAHRAGPRREAVGADDDADVGDDPAHRGGDLPGEHSTVSADGQCVVVVAEPQLVYERRVRALPVRPAGVDCRLDRRCRSIAAQRCGRRDQQFLQLLGERALRLRDARRRRRSVRQPLHEQLRPAEAVPDAHPSLVSLRRQRRALPDRQVLRARVSQSVPHRLAEGLGLVVWAAERADACGEPIGRVRERRAQAVGRTPWPDRQGGHQRDPATEQHSGYP